MTNAKVIPEVNSTASQNGAANTMPSIKEMEKAIQMKQEAAAEIFKVKYEELCAETGFQITGFPATTVTGENLFALTIQLQVSPVKTEEKEND